MNCYLECEKKKKSFNRVETTVNKITEEKIISCRNVTSDFEQFFQIIELPMNITTNLQNQHY